MNQQIKIQHLYWRAGFGPKLDEYSQWANLSIGQAVDKMFSQSVDYQEVIIDSAVPVDWQTWQPMSKEERRRVIKDARRLIRTLNLKWLKQMTDTPAQLREKMTFFWHGHFACQAKNVFQAQAQINTLRKYALGKLGDLLEAVAKDPAMLRFLNNQQNRKAHPNENFARELLELFTLGRGNYTEQDIKEAARAFTGWSSEGERFVFRQNHHDFDKKTFMGKTGNWGGEDIIRIVLENRQTARFITTKIYRFLVNEVPDNERISQLAEVFYQSNYDIGLLLRQILTSDWFYADQNIGAKIKSPIELIVGLQRQFNLKFSQENSPLFLQKILGQMLLYPPNVAGWAGGRNWIDSSSLLFRLRLPEAIYRASEVDTEAKEEEDVQKSGVFAEKIRRFEAEFDWQPLLKHCAGETNQKVAFEMLKAYFLQKKPLLAVELEKHLAGLPTNAETLKQWAVTLAGLPEYQVC
ncbi:MAG: DUF1800 domain-containing protein [Microscillaceae bacterium]|jgi:uncharacterized protein (DUF1800 family)|nr:DUF1800 domain-containing protein [Microscillaceae bacterium]